MPTFAAKSDQATRLTELRRRTGMTQRDVANKAGVSPSRITAYEADSSITIKMPVLKKLATLYKTTVEYIETGRTDSPKPTGATTEVPRPATSGPTGRVLGALPFMEYLNLPFVPYTAFGTFAENCRDATYEDFQTFTILKRPGVDYAGAVVIEVRGNSMAPRYPDQSCHVSFPVSDGNWQYASGVHAISLHSHMFLIKRITRNKDGNITLSSDATDEQLEIQLGDINCMWKIGETVYMSAED